MSRNRYDEAFGVCPIQWESGAPNDHSWGPVVVEVWTADTRIAAYEATKPQVRVTARLEVRLRVNGEWKSIDFYGRLQHVTNGEVRRHARLVRERTWYATIALDGWNS